MARTFLRLSLAVLAAGCAGHPMTADVDASAPDFAPAPGTHRLWLAATLFGDLILQDGPPHPF